MASLVNRSRSSSEISGAKIHSGALGACSTTSSVFVSVITESSGKETLRLLQRFRESIDLFERIIHGEGGPACRGHAKARQQRLGAMRPCPDRNAGAIDDRRDIMRMGIPHVERQDCAFAARPAENPDRIHPRDPLMGVGAERR